MTPDLLEAELRAAGLQVLAVSGHPHDPAVATVYLHGNCGQWVGGYALGVVLQVPGVRSAAEHVRTPAIILAWLGEEPGAHHSAPLT